MGLNLFKKISPAAQIKNIVGDKKINYYEISGFFKRKIADFNAQCKEAREKLRDIPGTNFNLGLYHLKIGNIDDAIMRFKMVNFLKPEMKEVSYYLGRCLVIKGDLEDAKPYLEKARSNNVKVKETDYILQKINSPESINVIPDDIVKERADSLAEFYSLNGVDESEIIEREMLLGWVLKNITDKNPNLKVLDIGAATGVYGHILKEKAIVKELVGVEPSAVLAKRAGSLKTRGELVYNDVKVLTCREFLENAKGENDLILIDRVIEYYGDLSVLASKLNGLLKKNGILAFMLDIPEESLEGFKLNVSFDNFEHSINEIKNKFIASGFSEMEIREIEIVEDYKQLIFVFGKK